MAKKDSNNNKALLFRQIELNWINAPNEDINDYIGLYLDSQPEENVLPVSVHKLNGRMNGQITTDYYLPPIDFYNETTSHLASSTATQDDQKQYSNEPVAPSEARWHHNRYNNLRGSAGRPNRSANFKPTTSLTGLNGECVGYCVAYHSRDKILAKNCLRTNPTWMQDSFQYIGARPLPSLMIPGSHNSGTYPKQLDKTVLQMINKYQMNQDESIFNQLVYGIRHLDLRVGYSKVKQRSERLWIYHDIFRTEVSVNEVFDQVKRFLDLTSHEIVIMDFHRFTVGFQNESPSILRERHAKLIDLLFKQLGKYIVPSYLGQHAPLNEYIVMGKRLIVGYADRTSLVGPQADQHSIFAIYTDQTKKPIRDIDAAKQDQEDGSMGSNDGDQAEPQADRRMGTRIYNKLKSLKLISHSFSKRSIVENNHVVVSGSHDRRPVRIISSTGPNDETNPADSTTPSNHDDLSIISKAALFFPPVRHLWPNKDTIEGLAQYMNETTCRKYFGELRSMMVELTPTVFGAISDKYDGNRRLAQLANRPVTDWIRDRWSHCVNIVASDYFLGNDLIRLSIYANKMRLLHRNIDLNSYGQCTSFRRIEHLLDKSKIPIQFSYQPYFSTASSPSDNTNELSRHSSAGNPSSGQEDSNTITHTSSDGNKILLRPLTSGSSSQPRDRRESFVDNVSDGFADLFSSFKRLLNL